MLGEHKHYQQLVDTSIYSMYLSTITQYILYTLVKSILFEISFRLERFTLKPSFR